MLDGDPVLNERLCRILVNLLKESTSGELVEFCVELMHSQSEHGNISTYFFSSIYFKLILLQYLFGVSAAVSLNLAKAGLCELLIQLLEKHKNLANDVDTRNLFKMACDLIIIILNNGNFFFYMN